MSIQSKYADERDQSSIVDAKQRKKFSNSLNWFFLRTKLFWGLGILILVGVLTSPLSSKGNNIFLSIGNLSDILRQVSVTGIVAVGMTLVILTAGIDLSVGSMLALGTVVCAMLLTQDGWTAASYFGVPASGAIVFLSALFVFNFLSKLRKSDSGGKFGVHSRRAIFGHGSRVPLLSSAIVAGIVMWWLAFQVPEKFGVIAVLVAVPCIGAVMGSINGALVVYGRLQPFIVTLAMMVSALGLARVIAGQDTAVYPVYTGTNATEHFEVLRTLVWGIVPVPGLFFLSILAVFFFVAKFTTYGNYLTAIGGNEEAARFAGINVDRTKIVTYAISGFLAALAGVLYVAQFRQGKPDAGLGLELDAIAAVVIGGTSLMGGKGSIIGTMVGVLIFGFLSNILQLNNIDSNTQLILKGIIIVSAVLIQEGQLNRFFSAIHSRLRREETSGPVSSIHGARDRRGG
ncbi:MAG: ABC transporter permease [Albidovulum sp.]|nr:ABC transporter permease [Albidovulum sp.]